MNFCILYCIEYDDFIKDDPYAGYVDDLIICTVCLKVVTPAPKAKKRKVRRRSSVPAVNGRPTAEAQRSFGGIL
jgi:uncharacterized membrane protein YkvA (DUF1232 family)